MAKLIHRSILPSGWYNATYWVWTPMEMFERWRGGTITKLSIENLEEEAEMIIVNCSIELAPIITALWMREVHDDIEATHYSPEENRLYLYYGLRALDGNCPKEREELSKECKRRSLLVMSHVNSLKDASTTRMDLNGSPLFTKAHKEPTSMIEEMLCA